MTENKEIYRCLICGNIVEVLHSGAGELVCCGKPMKLEKENSDDSVSKEKHVPVIQGKKVIIGTIEHPMEESHHIMWVEAKSKEGMIQRVYLKPGEKPVAEFNFEIESAREFCNLHGLWKKDK